MNLTMPNECGTDDMCSCGRLSCPRHLVNLFDRSTSINILENTLDGLDQMQTKNGGLTDSQIRFYNELNDKLIQFKAELLTKELEDELADATYRLQHPDEFNGENDRSYARAGYPDC